MSALKDYQVGVCYEADGYVTVRATSLADAKRVVRALAVQMDYDGCGANTDMMPGTPALRITKEPVVVEPEDSEE